MRCLFVTKRAIGAIKNKVNKSKGWEGLGSTNVPSLFFKPLTVVIKGKLTALVKEEKRERL